MALDLMVGEQEYFWWPGTVGGGVFNWFDADEEVYVQAKFWIQQQSN